jgi:DNA-binding MarR family transcriptional regulator
MDTRNDKNGEPVYYASKEKILLYIKSVPYTYFNYICSHFDMVKQGTISKQLHRLEKQGLVKRARPKDETAPLWSITTRGVKRLLYYYELRKKRKEKQSFSNSRQ